jgi:hypothetical protein
MSFTFYKCVTLRLMGHCVSQLHLRTYFIDNDVKREESIACLISDLFPALVDELHMYISWAVYHPILRLDE